MKQAVQFMIATANDNSHGYDQAHRNNPDYDCSSLVGTALNVSGFPVSKFSWTGNMYQQLINAGFKLVPINADRQPGDIFLTPGKHVVMCTDSQNIAHASINEKGTVVGGKSGDQTGKEICVRSFYTPAYGWKYHFRYGYIKPLEVVAREVIKGNWGVGTDRKKRLESAGYIYKEVQKLVNKMLKG